MQRTKEWYDARLGRFTASQISRLLGKDTLQKTKDAIDNFALEKAIESIYGLEEDQFVSFDMQRGIALEPLAFRKFKQLKELEFLTVKECGFYPYNEHGGASPDGIVSNNSILEMKCPKRGKFFKIVANGISEVDNTYIAQMQKQMLCTGSERAYFFNYHIDEMGFEYWHELIIERDEAMIDLIKDRIEMAAEIKINYINKIHQNKQF